MSVSREQNNLPPGSIISQQPGSFDLSRNVGHLEGHALELSDSFPELLPLVGVWHGLVECTLSQTNHLTGDTNATLVQYLDGDLIKTCEHYPIKTTLPARLVALPNHFVASKDIGNRNLDVVEVECTG